MNMVGGGGGISENRAVLVARVPDGSTVTATKGGITLTPQMWVVEADPTQDIALFVIAPSLFDSVNPWTVTATLGTDTASDTVIIDSNKEYDLVLSFSLWLHKEGVGLLDGFSVSYTSGKTGTVDATEMFMNYSSNVAVAMISPAIDLTTFDACILQYKKQNAGYSGQGLVGGTIGFMNNTVLDAYSSDFTYSASIRPNVATSWTDATIDISTLSGLYYFKYCCWDNGKFELRNICLI
jgi:hypothetical protein